MHFLSIIISVNVRQDARQGARQVLEKEVARRYRCKEETPSFTVPDSRSVNSLGEEAVGEDGS